MTTSPQPRMVALGAFGLAAAAGLVATRVGPAALLLVPATMAIGLLTLSNLGLGIALLPIVGAVVPFSLSTGTQSQIVAAVLCSAFLTATWCARSLLAGRLHLVDSPVVAPTVAIILVWVLALLVSTIVRDPLLSIPSTWLLIQGGGLAVALLPAANLLLALDVGRQVRWIKLATWSFVGVGTLAIVGFFAGLETTLGSVLATGGLFTMWAVALTYGQALFNERLPRWLRFGLVAVTVGWCYKAAVVQTWWFTGWLPTLVVVAMITFFRSRRGFVAVLLLCAVIAALRFDALYDAIWGATVRKGDLTRLDIWSQALEVVRHYPILGTGPAGYAPYFQTLYAGSPFSLSTHSNYLDILAETGIVGAVVFAWFLVGLARAGWTARNRWQHGFLGGYAQGAFAGLVGLVVAMSQGDWFIPFVYNQTIAGFRYTVHSWIFLGLLAGLALVPHEPAAE